MPKGVFGERNPAKRPEVRKKISEAKMGHSVSEATREKIRNKRKYQIITDSQKLKMSISHRGSKSSGWKGGKMSEYPENDKIRKSFEYILWRKSVFTRDDFTCQKYKTQGGKLVAHHMNNFADFPELRLAIDNGITLSKKAHDEVHKIYGKNNNTKGQIEKFIKGGTQ